MPSSMDLKHVRTYTALPNLVTFMSDLRNTILTQKLTGFSNFATKLLQVPFLQKLYPQKPKFKYQ